MELGKRLKQARLEAGLSQRQLCGDVITRNMLSQIENGSAKPSMETLRYLAGRLEKPVSFFLEEDAITSPNQERLLRARQALADQEYSQVLEALKDWQENDPVFDYERFLLEAFAEMGLAETALSEGKTGYGTELLEKAADAGKNTPYYTQELEKRRVSLFYKAHPEKAAVLTRLLPEDSGTLLLQAEAALQEGNPARCGLLLDAAAPCEEPRWQLLRAEAYFQQREYKKALEHFTLAEAAYPEKAIWGMEACCRELEDFKMAYHYACKLRDIK